MFKTSTNLLSQGRQLAVGLATLAVLFGSVHGAMAMSQDTIDKTLVKTSPEVFGLLKTEFPTDYQALVVALEQAEADGGDIRTTTAGQIAAWRVSQADSIVSADDEAHIEMLSHYVDTLAQLRAVGGGELCGDYILYGAANLADAKGDEPYIETTTHYLISMMQAAASARDLPTRRKAASDADWDHLFSVMQERGGSDTDINALIAMDALDPNFCDATLRLLDAMLVDGDKAVSRVRAEYIGDLVRTL